MANKIFRFVSCVGGILFFLDVGHSYDQAVSENHSILTSKDVAGVHHGTNTPAPGLSGVLQRISLSYGSTVLGATTSETNFELEPHDEGPSPLPLFHTEHELGVGYRISESFLTSMVMPWNMSQGLPFELQDPFLKLSHANLLSSDFLILASELRFAVPLSTPSREKEVLTSVVLDQVLRWSMPSTKLTLAVRGMMHTDFHYLSSKNSLPQGHLAPALSYQLLAPLAFTLAVEWTTEPALVRRLVTHGGHNQGTTVQPGFCWNMTAEVNVTPYLILETERNLTSDSAILGLIFNWTPI
ncbi:MAG: hypothetical protein K2X47_09460 [Bdellovibrionales bacterium]|nr:hypothetical protein [Bdellovibrionales bacterium]